METLQLNPQAYGEVFMFNGIVTGLTLVAFSLMVRLSRVLLCG